MPYIGLPLRSLSLFSRYQRFRKCILRFYHTVLPHILPESPSVIIDSTHIGPSGRPVASECSSHSWVQGQCKAPLRCVAHGNRHLGTPLTATNSGGKRQSLRTILEHQSLIQESKVSETSSTSRTFSRAHSHESTVNVRPSSASPMILYTTRKCWDTVVMNGYVNQVLR